MKKVTWISLSTIAPLIVSLIVGINDVFAGPPLLCHAIEIGEDVSLPWGDGTWQSGKITSDDAEFVSQTLALLSPDVATLTRMETIRRATIHAAEHPKAAGVLVAALHSRVRDAKSPSATALFDLGYLSAAYAQMNNVTDHNASGVAGGKRTELTVPDDIRPYDLVKKSALMSPYDPAIEFALALITLSPTHPAHKTHLQNAVAAASEGSLLAKNIMNRFGNSGQSLSDLRSSFGMVADGERR